MATPVTILRRDHARARPTADLESMLDTLRLAVREGWEGKPIVRLVIMGIIRAELSRRGLDV